MCGLDNIERICQGSPGGLKKLLIVLPEDIIPIKIFDPFCSVEITKKLRLKQDRKVYEIGFDKKTASFTELLKNDKKAGDYYEQSISFEVRKDRIEVAQIIEKLKNRHVHFIYTDENDQIKLVYKMRQRVDLNTRKKKSEKNKYIFRFSGKSVKKSPFFSGQII